MKASIAVARQTQAAEQVAESVKSMQEQLDRIEAAFNHLLEALARDAVDNQKEAGVEVTSRRGRPSASRS